MLEAGGARVDEEEVERANVPRGTWRPTGRAPVGRGSDGGRGCRPGEKKGARVVGWRDVPRGTLLAGCCEAGPDGCRCPPAPCPSVEACSPQGLPGTSPVPRLRCPPTPTVPEVPLGAPGRPKGAPRPLEHVIRDLCAIGAAGAGTLGAPGSRSERSVPEVGLPQVRPRCPSVGSVPEVGLPQVRETTAPDVARSRHPFAARTYDRAASPLPQEAARAGTRATLPAADCVRDPPTAASARCDLCCDLRHRVPDLRHRAPRALGTAFPVWPVGCYSLPLCLASRDSTSSVPDP